MRDFRIVRKFAKDWEKDAAQISEAEAQARNTPGGQLPNGPPTGVAGIGQAMNQFLGQLEEDGAF